MIIDDKNYLEQFYKIRNAKRYNQFWKYSGKIIYNKVDLLPVINVLALYRICDFVKNIRDNYFITIQITKSVHNKLLSINKKLLQFELTKTVTSISGYNASPSNRIVEIYDAAMTEVESEAVKTLDGGTLSDYRNDLTDLVEITLQLTEVGFLEFQNMDIGGVYRNTTIENLISGVLSPKLESLKNNSKDKQRFRVDIVPPDNNKIYYQLRIPNGHSVAHFASRLQKSQGLYSQGIGQYFQNHCWYIWPLYHLKLFDTSDKKAIIINVPPSEMVGLVESYASIDNVLYIYATGDTRHTDVIDKHKINVGTGMRYANLENLMDKYTVTKDGITTIPEQRNKLVVNFDDSETNVPVIKPVDGMLSSNPWNDSSKIISGFGNVIEVMWENSDPRLLFPGMPLRFIYKHGKIPYQLNGILLAYSSSEKTQLLSPADNKYICTTTLSLYCEQALA